MLFALSASFALVAILDFLQFNAQLGFAYFFVSFIFFWFIMKKIVREKGFSKAGQCHAINPLVGHTVKIIDTQGIDCTTYFNVKVGSENWLAINQDESIELNPSDKAVIVDVIGNKLIIKKL